VIRISGCREIVGDAGRFRPVRATAQIWLPFPGSDHLTESQGPVRRTTGDQEQPTALGIGSVGPQDHEDIKPQDIAEAIG
jgi:hypothetical protein